MATYLGIGSQWPLARSVSGADRVRLGWCQSHPKVKACLNDFKACCIGNEVRLSTIPNPFRRGWISANQNILTRLILPVVYACPKD